MVRYCDKCRLTTWPRTPPSLQGNFKCEVCGAITWCHNGPDHLEKQIEKLRVKHQAETPVSPPEPPPVETKPRVRERVRRLPSRRAKKE